MKNRALLHLLIAGMVIAGLAQAADEKLPETKPNVVVIFVDDLAYGDLGCFGCPDIPTPHIDSLATDGVRCTSSYVVNTPCSPSRCSIITGMYAQRFGKYSQMRGLPIPEYKDHPTMGEIMRDAGYVTGQIGKWDIGSRTQGPLERGFMQVARVSPKTDGLHYTYIKEDGTRGFEIELDGEYLEQFVNNNHDKPFFLYYSPRALHWPNDDAPEHFRARSTAEGDARRGFAGCLIALDDSIGKMINALKAHDLYENTLIMFTSDNGGNPMINPRPHPYRGGKKGGAQYEGYVRMPTIVSWPSVLPKGKVYNGIMASIDFYATAAAAAGKEAPEKCDGVNLVEYLSGNSQKDAHDALYWCNHKLPDPGFKAMRWKQWRYVFKQGETYLFDIEKDTMEENNLAAEYPEIVAEMEKRWKTWFETLGPMGGKSSTGGRMPKGYGWATASETPADIAAAKAAKAKAVKAKK